MDTVDIVFAILFALTVVFFVGWKMILFSWGIEDRIDFRRLALLCGAFAIGAFLLFAFAENPLARVAGWILPIIAALCELVISVRMFFFEKRGRRKQTRDYSTDGRSVWKSKTILVVLLLGLLLGFFFIVFLRWLFFRESGGTLLFADFILELAFALIFLGFFLAILFRRRKPGK